jgi:FKBP-type peptidyl-prolyl cis-trans isomerase (trigger factor)
MEKSENKIYTIIKREDLPNSAVLLEAEIDSRAIAKERFSVIEHLKSHTELDGFRKGKVPESVIISKVGEMAIWEESAEKALEKVVPLILAEEKLFFVARPRIEITKMAPGNPLSFKMRVPIMPTFELPDYKKIAQKTLPKKEEKTEVTEKEIDEAVKKIENIVNQGKADKDKQVLTDDMVKIFGPFKNLSEFREKIKNDLLEDKKATAIEKRRLELTEALLKATKMEMPEELIDEEVEKMERSFHYDVERMGMKAEEYLNKVKKTLDDLRKEWRPVAEKRTKYDIIAGKIAATENIVPTKEEVTKETDHVMEHHKDAKRENVKSYVEHMLVHRKVFEFLENSAK